jgi:hypothetical protein
MPQNAVLFGLAGPLARYNRHVVHVVRPLPAAGAYLVAPDDGAQVVVPAENLFMHAHAARLPAPAAALEDLTVISHGPHGRRVVATAAVPAGAVLKTRVLQLVMTPAQIRAVERAYAAFIRPELKVLMGLPPDYEQEVVVQDGYSPMLVFMRSVYEHIHDPILAELMAFDPLDPAFLAEQWDLTAAQDLLWLAFWLDQFAPELAAGALTPTKIWHLFVFARSWAFPNPTPEHPHGSMLFGPRLSAANCPDARWADIIKVSKGTMTSDEAAARHRGRVLSTAMFHTLADGALALLVVTDVAPGDEVVFDYSAAYASPLGQTVNNLASMPDELRAVWFRVYLTVAAQVRPRLAEHLGLYLTRKMPNLLVLDSRAALPRCANPACAAPMHLPRVCARCKTAKYCNRECQTAAWPAHKAACKAPSV